MMMYLCSSLLLIVHSANAFFGTGGGFTFDFGNVKVPACYWDATPVPEVTPLGLETICFDQKPYYDEQQVNLALQRDPSAKLFYNNIIQMYQPMNGTYFNSYGSYYHRDMCSVTPQIVLRVNAYDRSGKLDAVCNIVNPYQQNIYMATCGANCQFDQETSPNHFCIPDGYVERYALAFCPSSIRQCRPVKIKIPIGCSCKKYTCLKYAK